MSAVGGRRGVVDQASNHLTAGRSPPGGRLGLSLARRRPRDLSLRAGILHAGGPAAGPPRDGRALPDLVLRTDRGGARPPADYLLSSVVSFSTRRSMSSSTVPVLGRPRSPASSDSSFLVRPW